MQNNEGNTLRKWDGSDGDDDDDENGKQNWSKSHWCEMGLLVVDQSSEILRKIKV